MKKVLEEKDSSMKLCLLRLRFLFFALSFLLELNLFLGLTSFLTLCVEEDWYTMSLLVLLPLLYSFLVLSVESSKEKAFSLLFYSLPLSSFSPPVSCVSCVMLLSLVLHD